MNSSCWAAGMKRAVASCAWQTLPMMVRCPCGCVWTTACANQHGKYLVIEGVRSMLTATSRCWRHCRATASMLPTGALAWSEGGVGHRTGPGDELPFHAGRQWLAGVHEAPSRWMCRWLRTGGAALSAWTGTPITSLWRIQTPGRQLPERLAGASVYLRQEHQSRLRPSLATHWLYVVQYAKEVRQAHRHREAGVPAEEGCPVVVSRK